jgi:hypothetical protein
MLLSRTWVGEIIKMLKPSSLSRILYLGFLSILNIDILFPAREFPTYINDRGNLKTDSSF